MTQLIMPLLALAAWLLAQDPGVPEGFSITRAAEARFPMFACFDDRGRLYVTESSGGDLYLELQKLAPSCRVRRFEDRDGDGVFETSRVFAEGLRPSMGIAWRDGRLYVADPPDLVALEDTDGDGAADRRTVLLTGFGHRDNGSLHGLVFGPDGLLYMTTGEPDGYVLKLPGGGELRGVSGALIRCAPDGSRPEVLCRGFENLIELVFLPGGDLIGSCNWFQKPADGKRDALVHLVEGGRYPYAPERGTKHPDSGRLLPAIALYPAVAFSGLARYEGSAFPPALSGALFSAQHNTRKVVRHRLSPQGASYVTEDADFVVSENPDFHPSDVLEAPDGSLLVIDTGAWYVQHCPTGKIRGSEARGGLWRVRWNGPKAAALPEAPRPAAFERRASARALYLDAAKGSLPRIREALAAEGDVFVEHYLVLAAARTAERAELEAWSGDASARVRRAALILLDDRGELGAEAAIHAAGSGEAELRDAALRIVQKHPAWAPTALRLIEGWIAKEALSPEELAGLRSSILAFQREAALQAVVGKALLGAAPARRLELLEAIASTSLPSLPAEWKGGVAAALAADDAALRLQAVRSIATLALRDFDAELFALSASVRESAALRIEALRVVVARRPALPAELVDFLRGELASAAEPLSRLAAAEVLRRASLGEEALARVLAALRGDPLVSPSLFLASLRGAKGPALLEAAALIRAGWRPASAELGEALERLPEDARALLGSAEAEARAKLERYAPLLEGGNAERGRAVFGGAKVACASCHPVRGQGGRVGPDLTKIGGIRAGRDLLESILLPSSTFAQGYEPYLAATRDGDVVSGVLAAESPDAVTLRDSGGKETTLRRDRLRELRRSSLSVMPENLERALSEEEFRDLLAYLKSLR